MNDDERREAIKARLAAYLNELDRQTRHPGEPSLREAVAEQAKERLRDIDAGRQP